MMRLSEVLTAFAAGFFSALVIVAVEESPTMKQLPVLVPISVQPACCCCGPSPNQD